MSMRAVCICCESSLIDTDCRGGVCTIESPSPAAALPCLRDDNGSAATPGTPAGCMPRTARAPRDSDRCARGGEKAAAKGADAAATSTTTPTHMLRTGACMVVWWLGVAGRAGMRLGLAPALLAPENVFALPLGVLLTSHL